MTNNCKYVFVTGGVMSGIGKGVVTASLGKILQFRGFNISVVKIDPYLNVDPGTLNPIEHGECFITEQVWDFRPVPGSDERVYKISEIDQDFGTYERFLGIEKWIPMILSLKNLNHIVENVEVLKQAKLRKKKLNQSI